MFDYIYIYKWLHPQLLVSIHILPQSNSLAVSPSQHGCFNTKLWSSNHDLDVGHGSPKKTPITSMTSVSPSDVFFFMGFSLSKPPVTKNHAENSTTRSVSPRQKTESPRCAPGLGAKQPGLSPFRRVHSSAGRHQQDALRRSAGSARGCSWPETGTTVAVGKSFYAKKCRRNRVKRRKFVSPTEYGLLVTWRLFFLRQMVKLLQMMAILMGGSMILMEVLMGQT